MERRCLYRFANIEAEKFETSEQGSLEGRTRWNTESWWLWCSERYLEHLKGDIFWLQFPKESYRILEESPDRLGESTSKLKEQLGFSYRHAQEGEVVSLIGMLNQI